MCRALAQHWAERNVEQIVNVLVPQIETAAKPGDQAFRISADSHRRGRQSPSGVATTGPSDSWCVEDSESPAGAVRRQVGGCARDRAVDATTGPSGLGCAEDSGSPAGAVRRQKGGSL